MSPRLLGLTAVTVVGLIFASGALAKLNNDVDLVTEILNSAGYPSEKYDITTSDGYIITVHRIPPKNSSETNEVAVLMHGVIGSGADFVLPGKKRGFGNILHDQGYDVWLPSCRGTTWSKGHQNLTVTSPEYWDFSWHEIGMYDLAAVLDFVVNSTGVEKVHYTSHSQGSTVLLVLLTERPEYNAKLASVNLLAPIAFLKNLDSPILRFIATRTDELEMLLNNLGVHEILGTSALNQIAARLFCDPGSPSQDLCIMLMYTVVGFSSHNIDRTLLPRIYETTPAGVSTKQIIHFGQLIQSGKFQQFDYRSRKNNYRLYKKTSPPEYNLRNINVPIQMFYGGRDFLMSRQDVLRLRGALNHLRVGLVEIPGFNHIDLLYSTDAPKLIYKRVIANMRYFSAKREIGI